MSPMTPMSARDWRRWTAWKIAKAGLPVVALAVGVAASAGIEGMPGMPLAKERRVFTLKRGESLENLLGFGQEESQVAMMNRMMIEGSGMEGMEMGGPSAKAPEISAGVMMANMS